MILNETNKGRATVSNGYFRIGHVLLDIPPEDIVTSRVGNTDEITPLRSAYAMYVKTGQTRWDVTVRWTALATEQLPMGSNGLPMLDFTQWEDVRHILAIFRAAPFVEVESPHLRQVFAAIDPSLENERLAFALRQLRIENHPDIVNALKCTLTMTLFNYRPYSDDFAYRGAKGNEDKTEAYLSPDFQDYINNWIANNLDNPRDAGDIPPQAFPIPDYWKSQEPGKLLFKWRVYRELNYTSTVMPPDARQLPSPAARPSSNPVSGVGMDFDARVKQVASDLGVDPIWLMKVMSFETGGTFSPSIVNKSSGATGLIQFLPSTAVGLGTTTSALSQMTAVQQMDYVEKYFQQWNGRLGNQGDVAMAVFAPIGIGKADDYTLYRSPSTGYVNNRGLDKEGKGYITRADYTRRVDSARVSSGPTTPPAPVQTDSNPVLTPVSFNQDQQKLRDNLNQSVKSLAADEWQLDHYTDEKAFFFKEFDLSLTDNVHGEENQFDLFPQGFVLLFVNNLAQIPLASYQYPTYQHVGPATTMISIGLTSVGRQLPNDQGELPEPVHVGIQELNFMSHQLEEQYFRMKTAWRSQRSVYRMQAVRVYNQILNMLGVYGLMLNDITSATVPETSNELAVNVTARQYENVFEELQPYKVLGPKDAYTKPVQDYINSDDIDKGLSQAEKDAIKGVTRYRDARRDLDFSIVDSILQDPSFPPVQDRAPLPFKLSDTELDTLRKEPYWFDTSLPFAIGNSNNWNLQKAAITRKDVESYEVVWALSQMRRQPRAFQYSDATQQVLDNSFAKLKSTPEGQAALLQVMDQLIPVKESQDPEFKRALEIIATSPGFKNKVKGLVGKPSDGNPNHGAYVDLGLNVMSVNGRDWNPGIYFIDYSQFLDNAMRQGLDAAALITRNTNTVVNNPARPGTTPIDNTTPVIADSDDPRSMIRVPEYKMGAAFPTFKLFLIEEDNSGVFYALDDFYSYSTVTDIEIIRYQDKPDAAVIQLTNFAALLTQKTFDNTAEGRWEAQHMHRFDKIMGLGTTDGVAASPSGAGGNTGVIVGENQGENYMVGRDMRSINGISGGKKHTPLQIFALQPGSKIEVRMGFSNDPDNLTRVFAGTVAEVEGDEILTIRAQGFMAELMLPPADKITASGPLNILATGALHGPKFGGPRLWGDAGDSATVIEKMLQVSSAKHFGHWQLDAHLSPDLMTGFRWEKLIGKALRPVPGAIGGVIAPALQNAGDRSGQNIMVNEVANRVANDSTTGGRGARTLFDEHPFWIIPPHYYVEESGNVSPWTYIKDVSRRYPEYSLLVKDYGFPFGCDATLVFGHPRDFYISRPQSYDQSLNEQQANEENQDKFKKWWQSIGRRIFIAGYESAARQIHSQLLLFEGLGLALGPLGLLVDELTETGFQVGVNNQEAKYVSSIDQNGVGSFNDALDKLLDGPPAQFITFLAAITPNVIISDAAIRNAQEALRAVRRQWEGYRDQLNGGKGKDGMRAVLPAGTQVSLCQSLHDRAQRHHA
jgi:hypothetical protein